jgi:hypothetical protein
MGNDVVKKIYVELLRLDGVDQAGIDNVAIKADELTELEHCAIDMIEDAIGHLGPDHAAVKALGEDKGAAHIAGVDSADLWAPQIRMGTKGPGGGVERASADANVARRRRPVHAGKEPHRRQAA